MVKKLEMRDITVKRKTNYADVLKIVEFERHIYYAKVRLDMARKKLVANCTVAQAKQELAEKEQAYKNWLNGNMTIKEFYYDD